MKIINLLAQLQGYKIGDTVMFNDSNFSQKFKIVSFYFNFIEFKICCKLQRYNKDGKLTEYIFDGYSISGYLVMAK